MFQNKEIVIDIGQGGQTSALHMDEFPLSFLGRMEIGRASTIDFNPETQLFDVSLKDATNYIVDNNTVYHRIGGGYQCGYPEAACGFTGYDEARRFEVDWIQECRKLGVDPLDPEGIEIIQRLRGTGDSPQL